ncbi:MAG: DUF1772 domain-containing protein [Actinomycetota bacterium]|nr:DUF1772 domain-containing protein [Actinomycetota bacterium]
MLAFSTLVMGGLRTLRPAAGVKAMQQINLSARHPAFLLVLLGTTVVCLVSGVVAVVRLGEPGSGWLLAGSVFYPIAIVITGRFHIPRNNTLAAVDPDSADAGTAWHTFLGGWIPGNHVRAVAAAAAAVTLSIAARSLR